MSQNQDRSAYFDDLEPDQDWGTHVWIASEEFCAGWQKVVGDDASIYGDTEEARRSYEGPIAPPSLAFIYLTECIQDLMPNRAQGGVHARQSLKFLGPIRKGDALSTRLTITDKYIKRERKYVEMRTETTNQHGEKVLEGFRVTIWAA